MDDYNTCPVCGLPSTLSCKCMLGDRQCAKGHHWHQCPVHHTKVIGKADHAQPSSKCQCQLSDGRKRPTHVPSDATGWDETGWWTRKPIIAFGETTRSLVSLPVVIGVIVLYFWLLR